MWRLPNNSPVSLLNELNDIFGCRKWGGRQFQTLVTREMYDFWKVVVLGRNNNWVVLVDRVTRVGIIGLRTSPEMSTRPFMALKKNRRSIYSCQYDRGNVPNELIVEGIFAQEGKIQHEFWRSPLDTLCSFYQADHTWVAKNRANDREIQHTASLTLVISPPLLLAKF